MRTLNLRRHWPRLLPVVLVIVLGLAGLGLDAPSLAATGRLHWERLWVEPDPARPSVPSTRPALVAPYAVPAGSAVETWCGPGCMNHADKSDKPIKAYYAVDYGRTGAGGFPILAAAGGTATLSKVTGIPAGRVQPGCPVDVDPDKADAQAWAVTIDHGDGWQTFYLHMASVELPPDNKVVAGQQIGVAGCTGANSVHLHFDLRWRDPATALTWSYPVEFGQAPAGPGLDLVILIDSTGSMADDIDAAKARAGEIVGSLKTKNPNSRVAIMEFRDFAARTLQPGDFPYRDVLPFTQDAAAAITAINSIGLGHGGDQAEARNCALMHAMTGDTCAGYGDPTLLGPWRPDVDKSIIYLTDAPALSPEPYTNFTNATTAATANSGGFVLEEGEIEEAGLSAVAATAAAEGIVVYPIVVGGNASAKADSAQLAAATGGRVFEPSNAAEVVDSILSAIDDLTGNRLYLPNISHQDAPATSVCTNGTFTPTDVVFAFDRSNSFWGVGAAQAAQEGIRVFVNTMDFSRERAGLVAFSDKPTVDQALTNDKAALLAALARIQPVSGSGIGDGLATAGAEVLSSRHLPGNRQAVVLLTDGENMRGRDPVSVAEELRAQGVRIIALGIGPNVETITMKKIAGNAADYQQVQNLGEVPSVLQKYAGILQCGQ